NAPTAASVYSLHLASETAFTWPTASTAPFTPNFGPYGYELGSAVTSSVSLVSSGGTVTVNYVCQIARKKQ
ncbi:unnamed protein product, partial [marine sediment metagenome]